MKEASVFLTNTSTISSLMKFLQNPFPPGVEANSTNLGNRKLFVDPSKIKILYECEKGRLISPKSDL